MNCDPLARIYQTLEYLAFSKDLEKQRFRFLDQVHNSKKALLLGDGDGRFALELARRNTAVEIVIVEASGAMIEVAENRLRRSNLLRPERIRFVQQDACSSLGSEPSYDLIVTHFFLDCFSNEDVRRLVAAVRNVSRPGAKWLIAEFHQPEKGWRNLHARSWLAVMYFFFRLVTDLQTRRLPQYQKALAEVGFVLQRSYQIRAQLISSELWELHRFPRNKWRQVRERTETAVP